MNAIGTTLKRMQQLTAGDRQVRDRLSEDLGSGSNSLADHSSENAEVRNYTAFDADVLGQIVQRAEFAGADFQRPGLVDRDAINFANVPCSVITTKSGRPTLCRCADSKLVNENFWAEHRHAAKDIAENVGDERVSSAVRSLIFNTTASLLSECGESCNAEQVSDWYRRWSRYTMDSTTAFNAMHQSFEVALGHHRIDIAASLGVVWRNLHADVEGMLADRGLLQQFNRSSRLLTELDLIAFGPSTETMAKFLLLAHQGLVKTKFA